MRDLLNGMDFEIEASVHADSGGNRTE